MSMAPGTKVFKHASTGTQYAAGVLLFSAGDVGDAMYVVQEGAVEIVVNGVIVETVGPEGMFGEMALLDQSPRSTTARIATDSVLHRVEPAQFMMMVRQTPYFAMDLVRLLAFRLRQMNERLEGRG